MKRIILTTFLLIFFSGTCLIMAESKPVVKFVVGKVYSLDKNNNKTPLIIGKVISENEKILTAKKSYLELERGKSTIFIKENIELSYTALMSVKENPEDRVLYFNSIKKIINNNKTFTKKTTVAGIRAEKNDSKSVVWENDDNDDINPFIKYYEDSNFDAIIRAYEKDITKKYTDDDLFFIGSSFLNKCDYNTAINLLSLIKPENQYWNISRYNLAIAFHCQQEYNKSNDVLVSLYESNQIPQNSSENMLYLIVVNYKMSENNNEYKKYFSLFKKTFPESELQKDLGE